MIKIEESCNTVATLKLVIISLTKDFFIMFFFNSLSSVCSDTKSNHILCWRSPQSLH